MYRLLRRSGEAPSHKWYRSYDHLGQSSPTGALLSVFTDNLLRILPLTVSSNVVVLPMTDTMASNTVTIGKTYFKALLRRYVFVPARLCTN